MAMHSNTLLWKIQWTEEPGGLQSVGSQRVGHNWVTDKHRRKWQAHFTVQRKVTQQHKAVYSDKNLKKKRESEHFKGEKVQQKKIRELKGKKGFLGKDIGRLYLMLWFCHFHDCRGQISRSWQIQICWLKWDTRKIKETHSQEEKKEKHKNKKKLTVSYEKNHFSIQDTFMYLKARDYGIQSKKLEETQHLQAKVLKELKWEG